MEKEGRNSYVKERIDAVIKKEVTDQLDYSNGILFHGVPDSLFKTVAIDWKKEDQVKKGIGKYSKSEFSFNEVSGGRIGLSTKDYILFSNNGIIEAFSPRIVRQTPINFPPKIRYVQVENVVSQSMCFIESLIALSENCYTDRKSFTVFISLLGIKGVVFNATEKDYTTTKTFPGNTLTFQINDLDDKVEIKSSIEKAIHNTLSQFEPVA